MRKVINAPPWKYLSIKLSSFSSIELCTIAEAYYPRRTQNAGLNPALRRLANTTVLHASVSVCDKTSPAISVAFMWSTQMAERWTNSKLYSNTINLMLVYISERNRLLFRNFCSVVLSSDSLILNIPSLALYKIPPSHRLFIPRPA